MSSSTADNICKTISEVNNNDDVCEMNDMIQNMRTADISTDGVSICANCGKEGANNVCNKCKQVKYCNAVCKKIHKKKHKNDCEEHIRRAAEKDKEALKRAAELHDEELFKQPPPPEDCPICFQQLPSLLRGRRYQSCCGKEICVGCIHAPVYDSQGNEVDNKKCPFCRTPWPNAVKENAKRLKKRAEANDPIAIYTLGCHYRGGTDGFPQDYGKALELYHRASELGSFKAYSNIGNAYFNGEGVEVDKEKAMHYWELAAMGGDVSARSILGVFEEEKGNFDRALKHHMIAIRDGYDKSLQEIKDLYSKRHATKDDYTTALQAYQEYLAEIKSVQRDEAAAADAGYRYY